MRDGVLGDFSFGSGGARAGGGPGVDAVGRDLRAVAIADAFLESVCYGGRENVLAEGWKWSGSA